MINSLNHHYIKHELFSGFPFRSHTDVLHLIKFDVWKFELKTNKAIIIYKIKHPSSLEFV